MPVPEVIHHEYADAWNRRDWGRVRSLLHPEYTFTGADGRELVGGPDIGVAIAQMFASAFEDLRIDVKRVYVQRATAVAERYYCGTHTGGFWGIAATGRRVEGPVCGVIEVRDGMIYRERTYLCMMHLMAQLGVASPPAGDPSGPDSQPLGNPGGAPKNSSSAGRNGGFSPPGGLSRPPRQRQRPSSGRPAAPPGRSRCASDNRK